MPRIKKRDDSGVTARDIYLGIDTTLMINVLTRVLSEGGAVMFGQTRDNSKLIVTVYLDGEQDKEYCEDIKAAEAFLAQYQV